MDKARIVIYDDLIIIDETEAYFKNMEQLASVATSILRTTPSAEVVEVYIKDKLRQRFTVTNRGKVKKANLHPNWGGARPNSGPKRKGEQRLSELLTIKVTQETMDFLSGLLDKKAEWIRQAIREKRDREELRKGGQ